MAENARYGGSGNKFWGKKTLDFAKKLSRDSIEKHTDTSVLYLEVDIENSKRNFYGELLIKKFVNPLGIAVKGIVEILEGTDIVVHDVPNAITSLNFSCYINHLQELGIDPKIGDYFATKNRIYFIYGKQISDANKNSVGVDRETVGVVFKCVQADDEQMFEGLYGSDGNTKNDITGSRQIQGGITPNDGQP